MPDNPNGHFNPFTHKVVGPLLILALFASWLFSVIAAFYFIAKR